jgi:hypothetical protein
MDLNSTCIIDQKLDKCLALEAETAISCMRETEQNYLMTYDS